MVVNYCGKKFYNIGPLTAEVFLFSVCSLVSWGVLGVYWAHAQHKPSMLQILYYQGQILMGLRSKNDEFNEDLLLST